MDMEGNRRKNKKQLVLKDEIAQKATELYGRYIAAFNSSISFREFGNQLLLHGVDELTNLVVRKEKRNERERRKTNHRNTTGGTGKS